MEDLEVDITEAEEGMEVRMVDMVDSRMVGMEVKEDLEGDMTTGIPERWKRGYGWRGKNGRWGKNGRSERRRVWIRCGRERGRRWRAQPRYGS